MDVREPAVAGTFYPAAQNVLESLVRELLAAAPRYGAPPPKALIAPHAGYAYSGPVAASVYATLESPSEPIRRVVLLGPAHRVPVRGLAAPSVDALRTPLGQVPVDRTALARLADLPQVVVDDAAHAQEHSLEVQLPFLQCVLGSFSVVPLVVGHASDEEVAQVIERLWGGPETLVVVSSDLSHYLPYDRARRMDAATCRAIESLRPEALDSESTCGRVPVRGLLQAARRHGLLPRTLDLRSSGDTAGARDEVVGYGAWSFGPPEARERASEPSPTPEEDALLLDLARRSVARAARGEGPPPVPLEELPRALALPGACFVTLRRPDGRLRGCVGNLDPEHPLAVCVARNAERAALHDPRFPALREAELPGLAVHLSVLGPREPIPARSLEELCAALQPAVDGLVLQDGGRQATFLPDVWRELPEPARFVGALWKKAGLREDHWSPNVRAWRYGSRSID